jgi:hypothetical protein
MRQLYLTFCQLPPSHVSVCMSVTLRSEQVAAVAQGLGATVTGKSRSPKPKPEPRNPKPKTLNASGWRR